MSGPPSPDVAAGAVDLGHPVVGALLERCTFPPAGAPVRCGVSGGADSTALAVLAVASGCDATLVHVDHGLRAASSDDAEVVGRLGTRLGVPVEVVVAIVEPGPNLEERARTVRHTALGPDAALGHTADDQAEIVLLALLRGAGLHGLSGMRPGRRHPLLALRRSETRSLCDALDLPVAEDPTNAEPRFRRNRIRHEALPLLDAIAERDVVPLLTRTASVAADATDHLDAEAAVLDAGDARALAAAPPVLARLALRQRLRAVSPLGHPPDAATVERAMALARGEVRATEVAGGARLERRAGRLHLVATATGAPWPETGAGQ